MNARTNDDFRKEGTRKATLAFLSALTEQEESGEPPAMFMICQQKNPITGRRNEVRLTAGVQAMGAIAAGHVLKAVHDFDTFTEDNDPYGEHDFGIVRMEGETLNWKIDDYQGYDGIELVLTIMTAMEY